MNRKGCVMNELVKNGYHSDARNDVQRHNEIMEQLVSIEQGIRSIVSLLTIQERRAASKDTEAQRRAYVLAPERDWTKG